MRYRRRLAWPQLGLLAVAACGHSRPTTLHSLSATPPSRSYAGYAGAPVRVDVVRLPPAIDRVEMLRETSAGQFTVLEFDRWAAAPARLARQALIENLALRLPAGAVVTTIGSDAVPTNALAVDVLSFAVGPGTAMLMVNWTRSCRPGAAPVRRSERLEAPGADAPTALQALLGQLADRIAADITAAPDNACAGN